MASADDSDAAPCDFGLDFCDTFELGTCDLNLCSDEAIQQLKKWVCGQSRHLSMSKSDREQFVKVTEKYFSDLSNAMAKKSIEQSKGPSDKELSPSSETSKSELTCAKSSHPLKEEVDQSVETIGQESADAQCQADAAEKNILQAVDKEADDMQHRSKSDSVDTQICEITKETAEASSPNDNKEVDVAATRGSDEEERGARSCDDEETQPGTSTIRRWKTETTNEREEYAEIDVSQILDEEHGEVVLHLEAGRSRFYSSDSDSSDATVRPIRDRLAAPADIELQSFTGELDEYGRMSRALQYFLENDEYFEALSIDEHCSLLQSLLLNQLKAGRNQAISEDADSEQVDVAIEFFTNIQQVEMTPHSFRNIYETARAKDDRLCIEGIARRRLDVNDPFVLDGFLLTCFKAFADRTVARIFEKITFSCRGTCELCVAEDQLMLQRSCCNSKICYQCYSQWVTAKVLSRTVDVECPCCETFLTSQEIVEMLGSKSHRYIEILTDLNGNPGIKTCPQCNQVTNAPKNSKSSRRAGGQIVRCSRCDFTWCFRCHSPAHVGVSCKTNSSGAYQLREWSTETYFDGSQLLKKARKCPACKVLIEKNQGCNHITCNRCQHEFCYICGKNWRGGNFLFGKHRNRFSIFGCKRNLLPNRPLLRKFVRGTLLVLESIGIVVGAPIVLGLLLGLSPILGIVGLAILIYKWKR